MALEVYFVLTPRFLMLDLAGPAEAFGYAARHGADVTVHFVAPAEQVRGAMGLVVSNLEPLPASLPPGALVFLTGVMGAKAGYDDEESHAVIRWLRTTVGPEHRLATVCSAAMLAARAGLLAGRACTTHHTLIDQLRRLEPRAHVLDDRVFVVDGPVASSAGITAGIDLALHLIEQHAGAGVAQAVARELVVWQRRTGGDPQISPWLDFRNHLHPIVHQVQDLISRAPEKPWPLEELARETHTSVRNLTRLFREHAGTTIIDYHQRLRVAQAQKLLADRANTIDRVAELVGFGSARSLRRVFAKLEGATPVAVRRMNQSRTEGATRPRRGSAA